MPGPWEKYAQQQQGQAAGKPWEKYRQQGQAGDSYQVSEKDAPALRKKLMQQQAQQGNIATAAPEDEPVEAPAQTPGRIRKAWNALNTPIGSHFEGYNNETKELERGRDFANTEKGRREFAEHPIRRGAVALVSGMEKSAADMATPFMVAASLGGTLSSTIAEYAPEMAPILARLDAVGKNAITAVGLTTGAYQTLDAMAHGERPLDERFEEGLQGAAGLTGSIAEVGKSVVPAIKPRVSAGTLRKQTQEMFGAGEDFQKGVARKYANKAQSVREQNQAATETTLKKRGQVDEANQKATADHVAKSLKQLREDAAKLRENAAARAAAKAKNEGRAQEHQEKVVQTLQEREGAEQAVGLREQAEKDYADATDQYYQREDKVRATAKQAENKAWESWRAKTKDTLVDTHPLVEGINRIGARAPEVKSLLAQLVPAPEDAAPESQYAQDRRSFMQHQGYTGEYFEQTPEDRAAIDRIMELQGLEPDPIDFDLDAGQPVPLELIHRAKSILGYKLNRNEYPGMIAGEMKQVYKLLNAAEARGSMEAGALDDLNAAKAETAKYQQAFGRERPNRGMVGETRKRDANREAYADEHEEERLAAAAKYDPGLVEQYRRVQALREGVNQYPDAETARRQLPQPPDRPNDVPIPELETPRPLPKAPTTKEYEQPEKHKPAPAVPDLAKETREQLGVGLRRFGRVGSWVLRLVAGGAAVHAFHGDISAFGSDLLVGQVAVSILTEALQGDNILNWLSKPTGTTLKVIDSVPPADAAKLREALTGLAVEDARQGKKGAIDPNSPMGKFLGHTNLAMIAAASTSRHPSTAGEAKKQVQALQSGISTLDQ